MTAAREKQETRITESLPCPYFNDGRLACYKFRLGGPEDVSVYTTLLPRGYRRIGNLFYRPLCEKCAECRPLRLTVRDFQPSRSQRRTLSVNSDIQIRYLQEPYLSKEKLDLYEKYVRTKHAERPPGNREDLLSTLASIHYGYSRTIEMDYFLDGRLFGVGIADETSNALSSNYFYYDTDYLPRRPGVFSILSEIYLARFLRKRFYYLGYYQEGNTKMSYKKFFRPNQLLSGRKWSDFMP